jgi:hypothetical protein
MRWLRGALSLIAAMATGLLFAAAPAAAVVTTVGEATIGLQPRNGTGARDGFILAKTPKEEPFNEATTFSNPAGNPVLHGTDTYVIYWDPTGGYYHKEWERLIDGFMRGLGEGSGTLSDVFAVDTQYTDRTNVPASYATTFRGSYTDVDPYPKAGCTDPDPLEDGLLIEETNALSCLTNSQLQAELKTFIADHKLPTGMGSVFYLMTPPGVTVCVDSAATHCSDYPEGASPSEESYKNSFCSYHSDINPDKVAGGDANTIVYGVIPWTAGGLGDWYLPESDQTNASACQDGGFDPSANPAETHEEVKKETKTEEEAYEKADEVEKRALKEKHEHEGPHPEEPNQIIGKRGEDGFYDTGLADLIINQLAVEQQNIVTDPLLNGWQDALKNEATDECRNFFDGGPLSGSSAVEQYTLAGTLGNQTLSGHSYYLNSAFNLSALKLRYSGIPCIDQVNLVPSFTSPNPVNAGDVVGFDGMESDVELATRTDYSATGTPQTSYATYSWNFGDGSPEVTGYAPGAPSVNSPEDSPCEAPWLSPCAASTFHSYQYGGTYNVTLKITDVGGNTASITQSITVIGPPKPESPGSSGSGSSSGSGAAAGSTASTGSTTGAATGKAPVSSPVPAPVATAAILSRTLKTATRKGLLVSYSVNEQVAGHFEVLLSKAIAHRLGISGPAATGLPAGSAPEVVIARATLVTTKGGRSVYDIHFSTRTQSRLRRLHKVSLTLLMAVRNASSESPTSTTVISTTTLVA